MKILPIAGGALEACLIASPAFSETPTQPPMNSFNSAFYMCSGGGAFELSYNSAKPTRATLTTSNNNTRYVLARVSGASGPQFVDGRVRFQPSGQEAMVQGTKEPLSGWKLKSSAAAAAAPTS